MVDIEVVVGGEVLILVFIWFFVLLGRFEVREGENGVKEEVEGYAGSE